MPSRVALDLRRWFPQSDGQTRRPVVLVAMTAANPPLPPFRAHPTAAMGLFAGGILTPFQPTESQALPAAVRALLAIAADVPLQVSDDPAKHAAGMHLHVHVGAAPHRYTLVLHDPGQRALWTGRHVALSHQGAIDRSVLEPIMQRLREVDALGAEHGLLADVRAAWRDRREWLRVDPREWATVGHHELLLRLLFRCNQNCSFCWQDRTWPALPTDVALGWIAQAAAAGKKDLTLSGGEPTLHPDLVKLVAHGVAHGMRVTVQSNAIQLAKPHILAPLLAAGLKRAFVSYHSADAATSDALTAAPGTHRRTEQGIAACLEAGLWVTLNCVVEARTLPGLVDQARTIVGKFAPLQRFGDQLAVSYTHPTLAWDVAAREQNAVSLQEVRGPLVAALQTLRDGQVLATAVEGGCSFPMCLFRDAPEFLPRRAHLQVPDNDASARVIAVACRTCASADRCAGPRKSYLERFGEAGLVPFDHIPADLDADRDGFEDEWPE
jgi:hypothetical protein